MGKNEEEIPQFCWEIIIIYAYSRYALQVIVSPGK